ncbi:MAG: hypothetical protein FLDDKLPJ_01220 [Phycisphaerae bacterium]|nr:hypothetical protein [Phycisphaerae bacterium]
MSGPHRGISATTTSTLLLEALKDRQNDDAWRELDTRYRPILLAFAVRLGLSEADAADVAQDTMMTVLKDYAAGRYDRGRGRLRAWLLSILRFRIADARRARARAKEARGESAFLDLPAEGELEKTWDEEVRRSIVERSLAVLRSSRMNENTVRAFEMVALQGLTPAQAAQALGLTLNDVYVAKNRAIEKLRAIREELERAYENDG